MREILFRGKRKDNGEWIEGYYRKKQDPFGNIQHLISYSKSPVAWGNRDVDPETVGQYTGLTDKNGKKIFEGDILSAYLDFDEDSPKELTYIQVVWNLVSWCIKEKGYIDPMVKKDCEVFEVAGNIFDNPELIGKAEGD